MTYLTKLSLQYRKVANIDYYKNYCLTGINQKSFIKSLIEKQNEIVAFKKDVRLLKIPI